MDNDDDHDHNGNENDDDVQYDDDHWLAQNEDKCSGKTISS